MRKFTLINGSIRQIPDNGVPERIWNIDVK